MTSVGNNFYDFLEILPTTVITTKIEMSFLFLVPWPWAYFLNGPNAAGSIAPTLIRHWLRLRDENTIVRLLAQPVIGIFCKVKSSACIVWSPGD